MNAKLTLETAKEFYAQGGAAKAFALDNFTEEELTGPSYTITESKLGVRIKGVIKGNQDNCRATIKGYQSNGEAIIEGHQSNSHATIKGNQSNRFVTIEGNHYSYGTKYKGKFMIDQKTEFKGGIWKIDEDGTEVEMELVKRK